MSTSLADRPEVAVDIAADMVPAEPYVNVLVWFGEHRVADWVGPASEAPAIEAAWTRRFQSLRVETRPVPDVELAAKAGVEWT